MKENNYLIILNGESSNSDCTEHWIFDNFKKKKWKDIVKNMLSFNSITIYDLGKNNNSNIISKYPNKMNKINKMLEDSKMNTISFCYIVDNDSSQTKLSIEDYYSKYNLCKQDKIKNIPEELIPYCKFRFIVLPEGKTIEYLILSLIVNDVNTPISTMNIDRELGLRLSIKSPVTNSDIKKHINKMQDGMIDNFQNKFAPGNGTVIDNAINNLNSDAPYKKYVAELKEKYGEDIEGYWFIFSKK